MTSLEIEELFLIIALLVILCIFISSTLHSMKHSTALLQKKIRAEIKDVIKNAGGLNPHIRFIPNEIDNRQYYRFNVEYRDANGKQHGYEVRKKLNFAGAAQEGLIWIKRADAPTVFAKVIGSKEQIINDLSEENSDLKKELEMLRHEVRNQEASG